MKGFKGYNQGMICRGFKYEEGKTYEIDGEIKPCARGFHFCEAPLDVLGYYPPGKEREYSTVEGDGELITEGDKTVCSKITVGAKINLFGLAQAHVEWVKEKTKNTKTNTGDYSAATNRQLFSGNQHRQPIGGN